MKNLEVAKAMEASRRLAEAESPMLDVCGLPGPEGPTKSMRGIASHICQGLGGVYAAREGPPLVRMDFMYMKSDCSTADGPADAWGATPVATGENTRMCFAVAVDSTLVGNEYMQAALLQFVDRTLRGRAVRIQHAGEPAIKALVGYVQMKRARDTQDRCIPVYSSGSNGPVEARIK